MSVFSLRVILQLNGFRRYLTICFTIFVTGLSGCSGETDQWKLSRPPVYKVSGTVNLSGKPLEGAVVLFHSPDGKHSANGRTDSNGRFVLTTFEEADGATEGQHKVTITKTEYVKTPTAYDSPDEPSVALLPKQLLPVKISKPDTTDLTATVTAAGPNDTTFDLKTE
ncbi:MAG: carboxypeptidase-like regulatory domain-containing protein [Planctomyces sp.]